MWHSVGLLVRKTLQEVTTGSAKIPVVGNVFGLQECVGLLHSLEKSEVGRVMRRGRTTSDLCGFALNVP